MSKLHHLQSGRVVYPRLALCTTSGGKRPSRLRVANVLVQSVIANRQSGSGNRKVAIGNDLGRIAEKD